MLKNKKLANLYIYLPYLIFAIVVGILLSYQTKMHTTLVMGDGYFHLSRFYDAAQQIKTHNFFYFQTNWGFDQSGRIINAMYGPFFAYLMGFIALVCKSWFRFQIFTAFIIEFIAVSGIYQVFKKISKNMTLNTVLSLVYLTRIYTWNNGCAFGAVQYMLMPFIILCGIRMIQDKSQPINWLQLALVMSIVGQIHVMSTFLGSLLLIPFVVVGFIQTKQRKKMVLNLLAAIGMTLLLTANIWGSILYFKSSDPVSNPIATNMAESTIDMTTYPILFGLFLLVQVIYVIFNLKESKLNNTLTFTGLFFFIVGSPVFPWGIIQEKIPVLRETFQVPRRLILLAFPLLLVGVGVSIKYLLEKNIKWNNLIFAWLGLVILADLFDNARINAFYVTNSQANQVVQKACRSNDLAAVFKSLNRTAPDYLPQNQDIPTAKKAEIYQQEVINKKNGFGHQVLKDGKLKVTWDSDAKKNINLPIVMYKNSSLELNGQRADIISKNAIGVPKVKAKKGYNYSVLSYNKPKYFLPSMLTAGISWLVLVAYLIVKRTREK